MARASGSRGASVNVTCSRRPGGGRPIAGAERGMDAAPPTRRVAAVAGAVATNAIAASAPEMRTTVRLDPAIGAVRCYGVRAGCSAGQRCEPGLEPVLDRRPLVVDDREVGRIALAPIAHHHVRAEDPLEAGAEREQGAARTLVAGVGLELDAAPC